MYCKNRISDNLWAGKTNEEDEGEGKMLKIMHKIDRRKAAAVLVLLLVMILSVTVFSKAASDPENHAETIEALDEKKEDVLKLTATSAAAATALAAIPGDATTPVANKMADLSSYFFDHSDGCFPGKVFGHAYRICSIYNIDSGSMCTADSGDMCESDVSPGAGFENSRIWTCDIPDHPNQYECFGDDRRNL